MPSTIRTDIQGLRAIAVLLVLVFHVWPEGLSGGYVGVDVFFVISGFLMTRLLLRELEGTGHIALRAFYARRIRRLLPAASLTLLAVAIASVVLLPPMLWDAIAKEILGAAAYVVNFVFVARSVDYLALDAVTSPVKHYWSLSIEEQFYIAWPVVMIAAGALARRRAWPLRPTLLATLAAITATSLAWAIYKSFTDPAPAYFLTSTRLWELGIGGLVALHRGDAPGGWRASALAWAGLAAIAASGAFYTTKMPFPGYEALLPTLGTAAVIFASSTPTSIAGRLLGMRWMQYFGDVSYSLYLWHWPVVVFYPYLAGSLVATFADATTVIVASIVLAHISKYAIEDPLRHGPERQPRTLLRNSFAMGAACMATVVVAAGLQWRAAPTSDIPTSRLDIVDYPGATAFVYGSPVKPHMPAQPTPSAAVYDRGPAYGNEDQARCIAEIEGTDLLRCEYDHGDALRVVVVGDSHAAHWLPAFERTAQDHRWHVTALTKNGCAFADVTVQFGGQGKPLRDYVECDAWKWKALALILREKPDVVVISESPNHIASGVSNWESQEAVALGTVRIARRLLAAGIRVAAIKHTPWLPWNAPICAATHDADLEACTAERGTVIRFAALNIAARAEPRIALLDFDDAFCKDGRCPVVIGNVFVYRDQHHMTATFARTLAPVLHARMSKLSH